MDWIGDVEDPKIQDEYCCPGNSAQRGANRPVPEAGSLRNKAVEWEQNKKPNGKNERSDEKGVDAKGRKGVADRRMGRYGQDELSKAPKQDTGSPTYERADKTAACAADYVENVRHQSAPKSRMK